MLVSRQKCPQGKYVATDAILYRLLETEGSEHKQTPKTFEYDMKDGEDCYNGIWMNTCYTFDFTSHMYVSDSKQQIGG